MPQKLETLLRHAQNLPQNQSDLLFEFKHYKEANDASETNIKNFFLLLNLFARHLKGKSLESVTKEDVLSFLDSRKKPKAQDPDEKWKTTWNYYLSTLTTFYRWVYGRTTDVDPDDWQTPDFIRTIKPKKTKRTSPYKPTDVWLEEELLCVIKYCDCLRDKLIITLMWDMAGRNHEITKIRVGDVVFKEKYAIVSIPWDTKTGERTNPAILSFPYLRDHINSHPFSTDPNAYLILSKTTKKQLNPDSLFTMMTILKGKITKMLKDKKITGDDAKTLANLLRKPWNPYLVGRHSSITEKTDILLDHQLTSFAGWTTNTKRRATYSHRSGKQTRTPLLEHHGIEQKEAKKLSRKECPSCQYINASEASICAKCNLVLNRAGFATITKQEQDHGKKLQEQDAKIADQSKMIQEQDAKLNSIQDQLTAVLELLPAKPA